VTAPQYGTVRVAARVHATVTWSDGTTDVIDASQLRLSVRVHLGRLDFDLADAATEPLVAAMNGEADRVEISAARFDETSTLTVRPGQ
jgi:hypothetical protein